MKEILTFPIFQSEECFILQKISGLSAFIRLVRFIPFPTTILVFIIGMWYHVAFVSCFIPLKNLR